MDKSVGPVTPTKALLKRIHRRSSALPATEEPPLPALAASKHARRTSAQAQNLPPSTKEAAEERDTPEDEDEDKAVWDEVTQLLDTVQIQNERILELERKNRDLERELANEKERAKAARERPEKGLSRLSAIKVEREFLSQEMILKGLQRDNEDKTLEVESLRRRLKIMSDFLAKQYGEEDWQGVVAAGAGASALPALPNTGPLRSPEKDIKDPFGNASSAIARMFDIASPLARSKSTFPTRLGNEALQQGGNPFTADASSPQKISAAMGGVAGSRPAGNNDDVVIPTVARMQSPMASPSRPSFEHVAGISECIGGADASDEGAAAAATAAASQHAAVPGSAASAPPLQAPSPDFDPNVLLASIESIRLLVQGFERRNALRRTEIEDLVEQATLAEQRADKGKGSIASIAA
ncbi:hypothetical protein ACQY0O_006743 [Thecaphora frezii]